MSYEFNPFTGNLDKVGIGVDGGDFVKNGNTIEFWWNGTLVHSWTVTPVAPVGRRASLWAMLINN
jgi:hypothetical protein